MAMQPRAPIPTYKRRRQRGLPMRIFLFLVSLVLGFVLMSLLWVLAYRFINPPMTATMLGDVFAGRGAQRDWMPLEPHRPRHGARRDRRRGQQVLRPQRLRPRRDRERR